MSKEILRFSSNESNRSGRVLPSECFNIVPLLIDVKLFFDKFTYFNFSEVKKILGISPSSVLFCRFRCIKDELHLHLNFDGSFSLILFPGNAIVTNAQDRAFRNVPLSVSPETYMFTIDLRDSNTCTSPDNSPGSFCKSTLLFYGS